MIGKMNLLSDEAIRTDGMMDYVLRSLSGESINLADEPAPLQTISSQYIARKRERPVYWPA